MQSPVNITEQATGLEKFWSPEHITTINESHSLKVAKVKGEFIWHSHPDTDEVFQCLSGGPLLLQLCTTAKTPQEAEELGADKTMELSIGGVFCVPKGMQHRPLAPNETGILLIEKVGTVNTGDREGNDRTVYVDEG